MLLHLGHSPGPANFCTHNSTLETLIPEGSKSRESGVGVESNRPATNSPGIAVDSNRFDCLVKKSGLGVKNRGADLMRASGWSRVELHLKHELAVLVAASWGVTVRYYGRGALHTPPRCPYCNPILRFNLEKLSHVLCLRLLPPLSPTTVDTYISPPVVTTPSWLVAVRFSLGGALVLKRFLIHCFSCRISPTDQTVFEPVAASIAGLVNIYLLEATLGNHSPVPEHSVDHIDFLAADRLEI